MSLGFAPMIAPPELPNLTRDVQYPAYFLMKRGDIRCIYKDEKFYDEKGVEFTNIHLIIYFSKLKNVGKYTLDGEMYTNTTSDADIRAILISKDMPLPEGLKFYIYDCVVVESLFNKLGRSYRRRLQDLRQLMSGKVADYSKVVDVSPEIVRNAGDIIQFYRKYLKFGAKGGIIRRQDANYHFGQVTIRSGEVIELQPKSKNGGK